MNIAELLQWQWDGYARYHGSRANLLIHIVVVPLFLLGNVGLVMAFFRGSLAFGLFSLAAMVVSVMLQGRGHGMERVPPEPFTDPFNAVARIFLEQWITFPRYVLSGGWSRALREAA